MPASYANTREYLADYLRLLALRLHREVLAVRLLRGSDRDEAFVGLFLSDDELDSVLDELHATSLPAMTAFRDDEDASLERRTASLAAEIEARVATTGDAIRPLKLARLFGLSPAALETVMLLLAAEVDHRFARVYAYLQDDVARRWASPGLALHLLPGGAADDAAGRALFTAESPLIREQLVRVCPDGQCQSAPLIDRPLKLDDRIVEYLLDHDPMDHRLDGLAEVSGAGGAIADLPVDPDLCVRLQNLVSLWQDGPAPPVFFWGPDGGGKAAAAAAIAAALSRPLLTVDGAGLAVIPPDALPGVLHVALREARLRTALLNVRHADALPETARAVLLRVLTSGVIVSARSEWSFHGLEQPPVSLAFPAPGYDLRRSLWETALVAVGAGSRERSSRDPAPKTTNGHETGQGDGNGVAAPGPTVSTLATELAGRFQLTAGQIARAAAVAQQSAWLREGPAAQPTAADLYEGSRGESNPNLAALAAKIVSPYTWDDLVLPEQPLTLLRAIESQVRHSHTVYQEWGFERKISLGRGLMALFSGSSGTGKTMSAGILARSLGLDMYKIDLSGVVSKYIGETEKNLSRIFAEASTANAILFFDEADALFGKRSEVKDSHDRYANIEISYLLQRMEEYRGVAILATNLLHNLDEAFSRRMHFLVEFPFPSSADRERIWRGLFPPEAPRANDIDFRFLAGQFELAGGNIKNAVVMAAFLAAEDGLPIDMSHLVLGVAREMAKIGRPLTRADFGDYYRLARRR